MPWPSLKRSLLGVTILSIAASWVYLPFWLDSMARTMEARRGVTLGSAFGQDFGLRGIRRWADAMSLETGMTARALKWRLLVFPIGIPLIQRAINRAPALPEARLLT